MAPVINELDKSGLIKSVVCVTAQHREMLDQVLNIFGIKPDHDLDIMRENQSLTDITVKSLEGVKKVIDIEKPDMVLVHGDTTTTFAASLAAFYSKTKIGHVEAGLRTFDKYQPYPEEMNRRLTDAMADIHFAPTGMARSNLLKEGIFENNIFVTGNTAIDAIQATVTKNYVFELDILNKIDFQKYRVIAMTAHRRENLGRPLESIFRAVRKIVLEHEDIIVVYPVHLNPLVRDPAERILSDCDRVILTQPVSMTEMHNLINKSYIVLTDSGGLQEEAPALDKPVVVLRNVTERPEGIEAGTLVLAGVEEKHIYDTVTGILNDKTVYNKMASAKNPFGDGQASKRIVDSILYYFGCKRQRPTDFR